MIIYFELYASGVWALYPDLCKLGEDSVRNFTFTFLDTVGYVMSDHGQSDGFK